MELELKLILIGLPIVEIAVFIYLLLKKDRKVVKQTRQKIVDDLPARYEDVQYAEKPFIEYY